MSSGIEMRLWWGNHLVAEEFFRNGLDREVRFGSKDFEFPLAFLVVGKSFPRLCFTETMAGALYRPGAKPMSLAEVIEQGLAVEVDGSWCLALSIGDQVSVEVGDLLAEVRARAAPRRVRLPLSASADFRFANVLLATYHRGSSSRRVSAHESLRSDCGGGCSRFWLYDDVAAHPTRPSRGQFRRHSHPFGLGGDREQERRRYRRAGHRFG